MLLKMTRKLEIELDAINKMLEDNAREHQELEAWQREVVEELTKEIRRQELPETTKKPSKNKRVAS